MEHEDNLTDTSIKKTTDKKEISVLSQTNKLIALVITFVAAVVFSAAGFYIYTKYFKKVYIVDYSKVINKIKSDIEKDLMRNDQFTASLRVKQIQEVAVETEKFCRYVADENKVEIFAANMVFVPKNKVVDMTPQLIDYLQSKKLILDGNLTK